MHRLQLAVVYGCCERQPAVHILLSNRIRGSGQDGRDGFHTAHLKGNVDEQLRQGAGRSSCRALVAACGPQAGTHKGLHRSAVPSLPAGQRIVNLGPSQASSHAARTWPWMQH